MTIAVFLRNNIAECQPPSDIAILQSRDLHCVEKKTNNSRECKLKFVAFNLRHLTLQYFVIFALLSHFNLLILIFFYNLLVSFTAVLV